MSRITSSIDENQVENTLTSMNRDMVVASQVTLSPDETLYAMAFNESDNRTSTWGMLCPILWGFRVYDLSSDKFLLGKSEECDCAIVPGMFPDDRMLRYISKRHFVISKPTNSPPAIIDLSKAGTFINGKRLERTKLTQLKNNDLIAIGSGKINVFVFKSFQDTDDNAFLPKNLQQKYEVARYLGSGGFGVVNMVFDKNTYRPYAIKKIKKSGHYASTEIDIIRMINHPFIISFIDGVESMGEFFIIMEYMDDGDLHDYMRHKGRLTELQARYIFLQILPAVEYLHNLRIIHRDLKPTNILKKASVEDYFIFKIADFGLGKILGDESMTDSTCGTEAFMAPEIFIHDLYTSKVDVWSMGVLLYYLLSSDLPFKVNNCGPVISDILFGNLKEKITNLKDVSHDAEDLIVNTLKTAPRKRFSVRDIQKHPWITKDKFAQEKVRGIMENNNN